jgi:hypothetical protein
LLRSKFLISFFFSNATSSQQILLAFPSKYIYNLDISPNSWLSGRHISLPLDACKSLLAGLPASTLASSTQTSNGQSPYSYEGRLTCSWGSNTSYPTFLTAYHPAASLLLLEQTSHTPASHSLDVLSAWNAHPIDTGMMDVSLTFSKSSLFLSI